MLTTVVLKFGGASVKTTSSFPSIADIIAHQKQHFDRVVVVISAMGSTTNQLIDLAHSVSKHPPKREVDMLISVGERISISLLAMALYEKGLQGVSFTGSQSGIITDNQHSDAKILRVRPHRLESVLSNGKIAIVAGFQGVSQEGEITTLGRGGSDTSAVALGVALGASRVEFYKDVDGFYTKNPKDDPSAKKIDQLTYDEALTLSEGGKGVLHERSIRLAQKYALPLRICPFTDFLNHKGSLICNSISSADNQPLIQGQPANSTELCMEV